MPVARPRGTKRMGLKYERDFGKALQQKYPGAVLLGQWFYFGDSNGTGYCQPDVIVKFPHEVVIFECKLTDTLQGRSQLSKLYFPVVGQAYSLPVRGIVVTRHLSQETNTEETTDLLSEALDCARSAGDRYLIPTLHWRERSPLL